MRGSRQWDGWTMTHICHSKTAVRWSRVRFHLINTSSVLREDRGSLHWSNHNCYFNIKNVNDVWAPRRRGAKTDLSYTPKVLSCVSNFWWFIPSFTFSAQVGLVQFWFLLGAYLYEGCSECLSCWKVDPLELEKRQNRHRHTKSQEHFTVPHTTDSSGA